MCGFDELRRGVPVVGKPHRPPPRELQRVDSERGATPRVALNYQFRARTDDLPLEVPNVNAKSTLDRRERKVQRRMFRHVCAKPVPGTANQRDGRLRSHWTHALLVATLTASGRCLCSWGPTRAAPRVAWSSHASAIIEAILANGSCRHRAVCRHALAGDGRQGWHNLLGHCG